MKKKHTIYIVTSLVVISLMVAAYFIYSHSADNDTSITTTTDLMRVIPRQQLYVSTAIIEDYTTQHATEYHLGFFPEDHQCALVVKQKVSYVLNTADIGLQVYHDSSSNTPRVMVAMPPLEYTASTQSVDFISDDEAFWAQQLPSTSDMKRRVEQQIRHRIDTPESRRRAIIHAQEAITALLKQIGYEADFQPMAHPDTGD